MANINYKINNFNKFANLEISANLKLKLNFEINIFIMSDVVEHVMENAEEYPVLAEVL